MDEAIALITDRAEVLPATTVALADAAGRVLAEDVVSALDLPPFANSAMDGFALRSVDTVDAGSDSPARLRLTGESRAGAPAQLQLLSGCAMRISTGAAMPEGADAVIRVEHAVLEEDELLASAPIAAAQDVRPAGDDIARGQTVLRAGELIGAGELAMLSSIGEDRVSVRARPRVAVIATGDELVVPGQPLAHGQIYDSNSLMLAELVRAAGAELVSLSTRVADERPAVDAALGLGLKDCDVLIVCGGVSMGEHDHVKAALAGAGVEQVFWQVALRPGHPTWFGALRRADGSETLVLGLPGNPVSAYVTFQLFATAALSCLSGADRRPLMLTARFRGQSVRKKLGFTQALRCRLFDDGGDLVAELTAPNQRSHAVSSTVGTDALALLGQDLTELSSGDSVRVQLLRS
ncbi:MAG: molybdopterin molybdotransferase MoeA [Thermoleophilaceae bacterium]|nr:molybdopterin molybdotransferase MoeA [Thermoleophilaceae bacterium]